ASMEKLLPANQREAKSIITSKCERWGYNTAYVFPLYAQNIL
ncbi:hypothetical protein FHS78_002193, partial [Parvibaculum indicum]|nr:hypothetical protein [Parvibaculum indicum]